MLACCQVHVGPRPSTAVVSRPLASSAPTPTAVASATGDRRPGVVHHRIKSLSGAGSGRRHDRGPSGALGRRAAARISGDAADPVDAEPLVVEEAAHLGGEVDEVRSGEVRVELLA